MKTNLLTALIMTALLVPFYVSAKDSDSSANEQVVDQFIAHQRDMLAKNTKEKGYGPQSPRDIDSSSGNNNIAFSTAPVFTEMNLCNIHFHRNAEHKGGEFTKYAGNGDGHGYHSGYMYSGHLTAAELEPLDTEICPSKHGNLRSGDTIEIHYVHSTAQVKPGPTLGACLNDSIKNPQLRVETQVYVLINDTKALDFGKLTKYYLKNGFYQALNIPDNTGDPIQYASSTTGPSYNENGSPFQVTWNVRRKIAKVNIKSVGEWCKGNVFNEDHAHGVRNLVVNPDLLSNIAR